MSPQFLNFADTHTGGARHRAVPHGHARSCRHRDTHHQRVRARSQLPGSLLAMLAAAGLSPQLAAAGLSPGHAAPRARPRPSCVPDSKIEETHDTSRMKVNVTGTDL